MEEIPSSTTNLTPKEEMENRTKASIKEEEGNSQTCESPNPKYLTNQEQQGTAINEENPTSCSNESTKNSNESTIDSNESTKNLNESTKNLNESTIGSNESTKDSNDLNESYTDLNRSTKASNDLKQNSSELNVNANEPNSSSNESSKYSNEWNKGSNTNKFSICDRDFEAEGPSTSRDFESGSNSSDSEFSEEEARGNIIVKQELDMECEDGDDYESSMDFVSVSDAGEDHMSSDMKQEYDDDPIYNGKSELPMRHKSSCTDIPLSEEDQTYLIDEEMMHELIATEGIGCLLWDIPEEDISNIPSDQFESRMTEIKQRIWIEGREERRSRVAMAKARLKASGKNVYPMYSKIKRRVKARLIRQFEPEHKRVLRLEQDKIRMRQKRASLTPEEYQTRKEMKAKWMRWKRATESEEAKRVRREKKAEQMRIRRATESYQVAQARRERKAEAMRIRRATEDPSKAQARKERKAEQMRLFRSQESEAREIERAKDRIRKRIKLANETPEQANARRAKNNLLKQRYRMQRLMAKEQKEKEEEQKKAQEEEVVEVLIEQSLEHLYQD